MPRLRPTCLVALASAVLAVAPPERALAQAPAALRASIDAAADDDATAPPKPERPARPARPPATSTPSRIGQVPVYGTPPAAGAGDTGFDSTNSRRRRGRPPPGVPAPLNIQAPVPPGSSWSSRPGLPRLPATSGSSPPGSPGSSDALTGGAPPPLSAPPAPRPRNQRATGAARSTAAPGVAVPGTAAVNGTTPVAPAPASLPPGAVPALGSAPVAAGPIPYPAAVAPLVAVPRKPPTEEDPYDPAGIRVGTFMLKPALETSSGYDTNPARLPGGQGSWFYVVAPELLVRSDWDRHQLNADLHSSYSEYPSVALADRPLVDAKVDGRIDITRDAQIDLQGRYLLSTDYPGSPNLPAGIAKLPIFQTVGGTVGGTERFDRLEVSLKGAIDYTAYQDSLLTDGTSSSNKDRDYTQYSAVLRGSYELTPGLKPFAELYADTRVHVLPVDRNGEMRDSDGLVPSIGTTFELSRKLTGSVSVGYEDRTFKDPGLPNVRGLLVNGSLIWIATGLTTVKLTAKAIEAESVLPQTSGVLSRDAGIEVDHAFRRWLIGTAKFGLGIDDYVGAGRIDHRYSASLGLAYKLNRSVQVRGEVREEWLQSNVSGVDYTATIALVGLRLQR